MVKNPFEIEEEENADAEEGLDDDGSSSGGSDVSRKGSLLLPRLPKFSPNQHLVSGVNIRTLFELDRFRCIFCDRDSRN